MPSSPAEAPRPRGGEGRGAGAEAADEGSAVVEFVALGTLLLVPVVYFVLTVAHVQAGAFAVVAAAQQAAQVLAQAEPGTVAEEDLAAAAQLAAADHGFAPGALELGLDCPGEGCAAPGGVATVRAALTVELPLVPGLDDLGIARLSSSATVVVGRYA